MVLGAWKVWGKSHTDESDHTRAVEFQLEVCVLYSSLKCHSFIAQRRTQAVALQSSTACLQPRIDSHVYFLPL